MRLLENSLYISDLKKACFSIDLSALENKTIAVTGGVGLIGSVIVDLLVSYGKIKKVYVLATSESRFEERFGNADLIQFVQYDAIQPLCLQIKPDYIIHCAGLATPSLYTSKPVETILGNFEGIKNLLDFSRENNVKKVLYVSSSEVYGEKQSQDPFAEDMYGLINIDELRSSYAVAKRASETLCKSFSYEYNVDVVIVRPGHIYGPSATEKDKRVSSEFALKAAKGETLTLKSAGLQKRSYCYVVNCAVQILTALLYGHSGEAYNIGSEEVTTIREMAQIYAAVGGVKLEATAPTEEELKYFNPMDNASLDISKIKELGYRDIFTVYEGLEHTVRILKDVLAKVE